MPRIPSYNALFTHPIPTDRHTFPPFAAALQAALAPIGPLTPLDSGRGTGWAFTCHILAASLQITFAHTDPDLWLLQIAPQTAEHLTPLLHTEIATHALAAANALHTALLANGATNLLWQLDDYPEPPTATTTPPPPPIPERVPSQRPDFPLATLNRLPASLLTLLSLTLCQAILWICGFFVYGLSPGFLLSTTMFTLPAVGIAGLLFFLERRKSRRERALLGKCPLCHYGLRASPARCPECGHLPETTPLRPPPLDEQRRLENRKP